MSSGPSSISNLLHHTLPSDPRPGSSLLITDHRHYLQDGAGTSSHAGPPPAATPPHLGDGIPNALGAGEAPVESVPTAHLLSPDRKIPSHHGTLRLYQCAHCQKRYSRPEHLARHVQTHTLGKRFVCHICTKAFARQDLLKRHVTNHENDNDPNKKRRRISASPGSARVSHACRACAAARVKCEEQKPCSRCRKRGVECQYSSSEAGPTAATISLGLAASPGTYSTPASMGSPSVKNSPSDPASSGSYIAAPQYSHGTLSTSRAHDSQFPSTQLLPVMSGQATQLPSPHHEPVLGHGVSGSAASGPYGTADGGDPGVDMSSVVSFSDFLQNVIYEPDAATSRIQEAQGLAVLDIGGHVNLDMDKGDFSLLGYWSAHFLGDAAVSQTLTPESDDSVDLSQMRQNLVKLWTDSPWRWHPSGVDSSYQEQSNLPVSAGDAAGAVRESRKRLRKTVPGKLEQSGRDGVMGIVLKSCKSNEMMARVASAFPSVDLMNSLIHIFLASHFCQTSQWIHQATFDMNAQWPDWLAMAAASGAILTPVPTLRKWGFAVQEAVRMTIAENFEKTNTAIKALGLVQALVLTQDVALWSGNRRKMEIAECHLGIPVTMMRYRNKFQRSGYPLVDLSLSDEGAVLDQKWRSWCERESWKRLAFHCYIRDAQSSICTLVNPGMSYAELTLPLPESKELWFAATADEWKKETLQRNAGESKRPPCVGDLFRDIQLLAANRHRIDVQMSVSIYLHGFWSLIMEYQRLCSVLRSRIWLCSNDGTDRSSAAAAAAASGSSGGDQLLRSRHADLCRQLEDFQALTSDWEEILPQERLMLHLVLMNLHLSLDDLQLFSGKEGEQQARRVLGNLRAWAHSVAGRQALWHAGQVLRYAKLFPSGHLKDFYAVAVHHAALAFWTFGVVTRASGGPPGRSMTVMETVAAGHHGRDGPVHLDGVVSGAVNHFIGYGQGRPVIEGPAAGQMSGTAAVQAGLGDPKGCMGVAQQVLRANFNDGKVVLPPIVENMCQILKQLGDAAWAVGLG